MPYRSLDVSKSLIHSFFNLYPKEAATLLNNFDLQDILRYLRFEPTNRAVEIFTYLNPEIAAGLIQEMEREIFIQIFTLIDASLAARLLSRLDPDVIQSRLSLLSAARSKEINDLLKYPPATAGFLMDPIVNMFRPDDTIKTVLKRVRAYRERRIVNINIVDDEGKLTGIIPLQEIAVARPNTYLRDIPQSPPVMIQAISPLEEVVQLLEEQKLISLPVVDFEGRLLGTIRSNTLINAAKIDATEDVQTMFGAGREERALSKVTFAIRKRLPWLQINLATAFLAALVVGLFEDTIARITVLAVFLPVVAGQSGNTGSQALAVTMRGLALREIRTQQWFRVARKEILVGFMNGLAVALTTSLIVFFWIGSFGLAIVIAVAMVISMVIAGLSGAVIPILLKSFGQDPAQSSSIVLTTVTDIVGFFSFLGLATLLAGTFNMI